MDNVKGFENLTKGQQDLLVAINTRHKAGVGTDYKDGYTPVKVVPDYGRLRVWFKNGNWLYYAKDGSWY